MSKDKRLLPYWNTGEELEVSKLSVSYTQPGDCCEDRDNFQTLTLTTEDGGGGPFIRMSIAEGKHFSIDGISTLQQIIDDFYTRLNYKENEDSSESSSN